jgi:hypothetical protein
VKLVCPSTFYLKLNLVLSVDVKPSQYLGVMQHVLFVKLCIGYAYVPT